MPRHLKFVKAIIAVELRLLVAQNWRPPALAIWVHLLTKLPILALRYAKIGEARNGLFWQNLTIFRRLVIGANLLKYRGISGLRGVGEHCKFPHCQWCPWWILSHSRFRQFCVFILSHKKHILGHENQWNGVLRANCCDVCGWMSPIVKILRGLEQSVLTKSAPVWSVGHFLSEFRPKLWILFFSPKMLNFTISSVFRLKWVCSVPTHMLTKMPASKRWISDAGESHF